MRGTLMRGLPLSVPVNRRQVLAAAGGAATLAAASGAATLGVLGASRAAEAAELGALAPAGDGNADGGPARPTGLLADLMSDALGVTTQPRLSWIVAADQPSSRQVAYQIQVARTARELDRRGGAVWDSGRVESTASVAVGYAGPALAPATTYHWRVRTWAGPKRAFAWSRPSRMVTETGPTWSAEPIWAPDGTLTLGDGRLEVELTITAVSVGLFLRAANASNTYLWQVVGGTPGRIKPHVRKSGTYSVLKDVELPVAVPIGTPFTLAIELVGDTISTFIDGVLVDMTTDPTYAAGTIGFRNGRTETQRVHSVRFTDPAGQVLVDETFEEGAGAFFGGTVTGGDLMTAVSQELLALLGETRDWAALRTEFTLPQSKKICSAFLCATGRSAEVGRQYVYRAWINGTFAGVGPARAKAGETRYAIHDVTRLVHPGANALAALCWTTQDQRFLAQLVVEFSDGTRQIIGTGEQWRVRRGARWLPPAAGLNTSYYTAPSENVDARDEPAGWREAGFDDSGWLAAEVRDPMPALASTQVEPIGRFLVKPASVERLAAGVWRVDLGREIVGGLRLVITGVAGQAVEVRLGEELQADGRVRYQLRAGNVYRETWRLRDGDQEIEHWGYRGFRWAELITDPALDLDLGSAEAIVGVALKMPWNDRDASFASSSAELDRVWELCRYSIEATRLDVYQDTPTRERGPYEGDALINQLSEYATQRSFALARYSNSLLAWRPTWPTEYRIMPVLLAWQDYLHTGDARQLAADYDIFVARNLDSLRNAEGLVEKAPGSSSQVNGDLVDWPAANRDGYVFTTVNTVINSWQFAAYAALSQVAATLGRAAEAEDYAGRAAALRAAINEHLLDGEAGCYADGVGTTHPAQHATAFPVALGVAEDTELSTLGAWLATGGMRMSVYGAQFLLDALYRCGRGDAGFSLMTSTEQSSWLHMLDDLAATMVMEAWDPSLKSNTTFSHAWGSAPANVVARQVAGVRVLAPGAATVLVAPQPGPLTRFEAVVPTIRGAVAVTLDRQGGFTLTVTLPANMDGRIELDLEKLGIDDPESLVVTSAGGRPERLVEQGKLILAGVDPGTTSVTAAADPGLVIPSHP
ncbi:MAG: family 78 glycoside hydrolase catalytic domain [Micromonosporaceae bacterium]|nr:family 78 glycoside hydrolase catalytic domain [Micromonosporaceae bacterium]